MPTTIATTVPVASNGTVIAPTQVPAPAAPPVYDPNSVVDTLKSKGMASDLASRTTLATSYGISGYTGTAAQNMALQALVQKGGPSVNSKTISGSSTPIATTNTNNGVAAAGSAVGVTNPPAAPVAPTTPEASGKTVTSTVIDPKTGNTTTTYSDGTSLLTPVDPQLAPVYSQTQTAINDITAQKQAAISAAQQQTQQNIAQIQIDKQNALDAATATYETDNPEGQGSDKDQYLSTISAKYDTAIANATADMNTNLTQINLNAQSQIDTANASLQTNVAAYTSNAKSSFDTQLKNLSGDTLTAEEQSSLLQLGISGGLTPAQAQTAVDQSQLKAATALNKTLSTEQKTQQTQAVDTLYKMLGQNTTDFSTLPAAAVMPFIQKAIDAGIADNPADAYTWLTTQNKGAVQQAAAAEKQAAAESFATQRLAIATENATNAKQKADFTTVSGYFKDTLADNPDAFGAIKGGDPTQLKTWIANTAQALNADPSLIALGLQSWGAKISPEVQSTVNKPGFLSSLFGGQTTTTKTTSYPAGGGSNPLGLDLGGGSSSGSAAPKDSLGILN